MHYLLIALLFAARPVDPVATETLDFAFQRSELIRSLVDTLERANVIVHIQSSRELPPGIGGTTRFVTGRNGYRYLRITIDAKLTLKARSIILGHELRHACEIAESGADDPASVRRLFEQAGHRIGEYFETRAAIDTERSVRMELGGRTLQSEPVVKFHH